MICWTSRLLVDFDWLSETPGVARMDGPRREPSSWTSGNYRLRYCLNHKHFWRVYFNLQDAEDAEVEELCVAWS